MFTVTSLTSSSISVTLTIRTLVLLSGTIISCGGQTVTLHVLSNVTSPFKYIEILPLSTVGHNVIISRIEWKSNPFYFTDNVTIQPPPSCGPINITNSSVIACLKINGNIVYNISIQQRACFQEVTTSFSLDCPLLSNVPVMKFITYTNGTITIDHEVITCSSGVWPITSSVYEGIASTPPAKYLGDKETEVNNCNNSSAKSSEYYISKSNSIITLPYSATGIICTFIISTTVTLIITLSFTKMVLEIQKRKKGIVSITAQTSSSVDAGSTPQKIEPIYDDIELTDKTSTIDFSKNVAYVCS